MFQRLNSEAAALHLDFEGQQVIARDGDSVAAALLAAGILTFRDTPAGAVPRGAYCMMGVCFDCLVEIDGQGNRQACMTLVRDGMMVRRQHGARNLR